MVLEARASSRLSYTKAATQASFETSGASLRVEVDVVGVVVVVAAAALLSLYVLISILPAISPSLSFSVLLKLVS